MKEEKGIRYSCPFCDEEHVVYVVRDKTKALINGTPVEYEEESYYCPVEDEQFIPKEKLNKNLLAAKDSYRSSNGLLTSNQIKEARSLYGMSQKEFSNMLGWGDVTIQRYEKKSIQDETYDQKIKSVRDNPKLALDELKRHKEKFDHRRYEEIKKKVTNLVGEKAIKYLNKEIVEALYINDVEESDYNGYTGLNINKVKNMIAFFAQGDPCLYRVKLTNLLWYSDALYFKKYGRCMSGLVYRHLPLGAVPIGYEEILRYSQTSIEINEEFTDNNIAYRILPKKDINLSNFSGEEIAVLQTVLEKFKHMGNREMSDFMHKEAAYKNTRHGDAIPYSLARELYDF